MPKCSLPLDRMSRVAIRSATLTGWFIAGGRQTTPCPISSRVVLPARKARKVSGALICAYCGRAVCSTAQTTSNLATAQNQATLNNVNQVTPFGTVNYAQPGGPNTPFTETVALSPQEQAIFDQGTANQAQAMGIAGNQLTNVQNALNTLVQPVSPLATGVVGGPIQYGFNPGPGLQYGFAAGGPIQSQIGGQNVGQSVQNATNSNPRKTS